MFIYYLFITSSLQQQYESLRGLTRGVRCHQIRSVFPALRMQITCFCICIIQHFTGDTWTFNHLLIVVDMHCAVRVEWLDEA